VLRAGGGEVLGIEDRIVAVPLAVLLSPSDESSSSSGMNV